MWHALEEKGEVKESVSSDVAIIMTIRLVQNGRPIPSNRTRVEYGGH